MNESNSVADIQYAIQQATIARGKNRSEARVWLERALSCGVMRTRHREVFQLIARNVR